MDRSRRRLRGIGFLLKGQVASNSVTGYVLELSSYVDNLFLFLLIFRYFSVPEQQQHRVLFWGVLGALLQRLLHSLPGSA